MVAVEIGVELGVIPPPVRAPALGARERRGGDQPDERIRIVGQEPEPVAVTLETGGQGMETLTPKAYEDGQ